MMLRCQNATGTTLSPAFSDAIHCTRKREKNATLPTRPNASQAVESFQSMDRAPSARRCLPDASAAVDGRG